MLPTVFELHWVNMLGDVDTEEENHNTSNRHIKYLG